MAEKQGNVAYTLEEELITRFSSERSLLAAQHPRRASMPLEYSCG
jgi:hypothetical protein